MFELRHVLVLSPVGQRVLALDSRTMTVAHICTHCKSHMLRVKPCTVASGNRAPCPKGAECSHLQQPPCTCYPLVPQRFCCRCGRCLGLSRLPYGDTCRMDRII